MKSGITVVVPVYNRADIVPATLDSLAKQTSQGRRLVLVDNNSTDGTMKVLQEWRRRQVPGIEVDILSEPCPGASNARNAGLAVADTEWVMFFDSDDVMSPAHIRRVLEGIAANPDADLIGWDVIRHTTPLHRARFSAADISWNTVFHGSMSTQRWVARTSLVREAGGWNPSLSLWDDIELGTRMAALGPRAVRLDGEPTVHVYPRKESITGEYCDDYFRRMQPAAMCMAKTLGDKACWTDFAVMRELALAARSGFTSEYTLEIRRRLLSKHKGVKSLLLRLAYRYTLAGLRGVDRIIRPFIY